MAASAFQRLLRVLELEERQGWRNRAVIGGLQAMAARWQKDAAQEEADPRIVSTVIVLMERYQAGTLEVRLVCAETMRKALAGEPVAIDDVADQETDDDETEEAEAAPLPPSQRGTRPSRRSDSGTAEPSAADDDTLAERPSGRGGKLQHVDPWTRSGNPSGRVDSDEESDLLVLPPPEPTHVARERVRRQQAASRRSAEDLLAPVTVLPGVGASTAELLARLGINRIIDLIWHLPNRHDDFSQQRTIAQLLPGEQVTVIANL